MIANKGLSHKKIVAVDVGTTKICVFVAQHLGDGVLEILGIGKAPSEGLQKGVVVDIAKTVHSIRLAIKEAELMCGFALESGYVGIAGSHIQAYNSHGVAPIKRGVVKQQDLDAVIASAKAIILPEGQQVLHVLPQYYLVDGEIIFNPLGMHGVRLEVRVHIITGAVASVQNLVSCVEQAGLRVDDIVLEQLASAQAVLSVDERELGAGVIDIGGGTSDFALYHKGAIKHTKMLSIAGNHFTNDLAIGLRMGVHEAERVKKEFGAAHPSGLLAVSAFAGQAVDGVMLQIECYDVMKILQSRAEELFLLVYRDIAQSKVQQLMATGLVITGGGSLLRGMADVARDVFNMPVRLGSPKNVLAYGDTFDNPIYATGYGLLLYAAKKDDTTANRGTAQFSGRIFARMKSWVSDFF